MIRIFLTPSPFFSLFLRPVPLARQQELLKKQYDLAMSRMQPLMREVPVVYSVVIPTYMQYDTLRRAIDSVIAQVYAMCG